MIENVNSIFYLLIFVSCLNTFVAFVVVVVAVAVISRIEIGE